MSTSDSWPWADELAGPQRLLEFSMCTIFNSPWVKIHSDQHDHPDTCVCQFPTINRSSKFDFSPGICDYIIFNLRNYHWCPIKSHEIPICWWLDPVFFTIFFHPSDPRSLVAPRRSKCRSKCLPKWPSAEGAAQEIGRWWGAKGAFCRGFQHEHQRNMIGIELVGKKDHKVYTIISKGDLTGYVWDISGS